MTPKQKADFHVAILQAVRRVAEHHDVRVERDGMSVARLVEALAIVALAVARSASDTATGVLVHCNPTNTLEVAVEVEDDCTWYPVEETYEVPN